MAVSTFHHGLGARPVATLSGSGNSAIFAWQRSVPQSHTATEQWQSFEQRMRRRRVERCVSRATAALQDGRLDEAREAIEEASELEPSNPHVQVLAGRISAPASEAPRPGQPTSLPASAPTWTGRPARPEAFTGAAGAVEESGGRSAHGLLAVAATLILLSGLLGWFWTRTNFGSRSISSTLRSDNPPSTVSAEPVSPSAPPVRTMPPPPLTGAAPELVVPDIEAPATISTTPQSPEKLAGAVPEETMTPPVTPPPSAGATRDLPEPAVVPPSAAARMSSEPAAEPARAPVEKATLPEVLPVTPVEPSRNDISSANDPALRASVEPSETPAASPVSLPPITSGTQVTSIGEAVSTTAAPVATSLPAPERAVEAALRRYEAAYSRLDANAVANVWPSVNRPALARAFDGLASQNVRLSRCDVQVAGDSARAQCTGTAQWTPKVGGGLQVAQRKWDFQLKSGGSDWVIVSATTR